MGGTTGCGRSRTGRVESVTAGLMVFKENVSGSAREISFRDVAVLHLKLASLIAQ